MIAIIFCVYLWRHTVSQPRTQFHYIWPRSLEAFPFHSSSQVRGASAEGGYPADSASEKLGLIKTRHPD